MTRITLAAGMLASGIAVSSAQVPSAPPLDLFVAAASQDDRAARPAMDQLAARWRDSYAPMIIDMARQLRPRLQRGPSVAALMRQFTEPPSRDGQWRRRVF